MPCAMEDWWSDQGFLGATCAAPLVDRRVYIRLPVGGEVQVGPSTGAGALAQARGWSANSPPPPLRRPRAANETRALAIELRTGQIAPDEMRRIRALHAHHARGAYERSADSACRTHSSSIASFGSSGGFTQSMAGAPRRAWAAIDEPKSFFDPAALSKPAAPLAPSSAMLLTREHDAPPRVQVPDGSGWWYYEGEGSGEASWQPLDDDSFSHSIKDKDAWSPKTASFHGVRPPAPMRRPAPTRIPPSSDVNASELRAPMRMPSSPIRRPGTMREDELRELRRVRAQETRRRNARARNAAQAALHER